MHRSIKMQFKIKKLLRYLQKTENSVYSFDLQLSSGEIITIDPCMYPLLVRGYGNTDDLIEIEDTVDGMVKFRVISDEESNNNEDDHESENDYEDDHESENDYEDDHESENDYEDYHECKDDHECKNDHECKDDHEKDYKKEYFKDYGSEEDADNDMEEDNNYKIDKNKNNGTKDDNAEDDTIIDDNAEDDNIIDDNAEDDNIIDDNESKDDNAEDDAKDDIKKENKDASKTHKLNDLEKYFKHYILHKEKENYPSPKRIKQIPFKIYLPFLSDTPFFSEYKIPILKIDENLMSEFGPIFFVDSTQDQNLKRPILGTVLFKSRIGIFNHFKKQKLWINEDKNIKKHGKTMKSNDLAKRYNASRNNDLINGNIDSENCCINNNYPFYFCLFIKSNSKFLKVMFWNKAVKYSSIKVGENIVLLTYTHKKKKMITTKLTANSFSDSLLIDCPEININSDDIVFKSDIDLNKIIKRENNFKVTDNPIDDFNDNSIDDVNDNPIDDVNDNSIDDINDNSIDDVNDNSIKVNDNSIKVNDNSIKVNDNSIKVNDNSIDKKNDNSIDNVNGDYVFNTTYFYVFHHSEGIENLSKINYSVQGRVTYLSILFRKRNDLKIKFNNSHHDCYANYKERNYTNDANINEDKKDTSSNSIKDDCVFDDDYLKRGGSVEEYYLLRINSKPVILFNTSQDIFYSLNVKDEIVVKNLRRIERNGVEMFVSSIFTQIYKSEGGNGHIKGRYEFNNNFANETNIKTKYVYGAYGFIPDCAEKETLKSIYVKKERIDVVVMPLFPSVLLSIKELLGIKDELLINENRKYNFYGRLKRKVGEYGLVNISYIEYSGVNNPNDVNSKNNNKLKLKDKKKNNFKDKFEGDKNNFKDNFKKKNNFKSNPDINDINFDNNPNEDKNNPNGNQKILKQQTPLLFTAFDDQSEIDVFIFDNFFVNEKKKIPELDRIDDFVRIYVDVLRVNVDVVIVSLNKIER